MKGRLLFSSWVLLWLFVTVAAAELVCRRLANTWHREIGYRHMQPYLMSGGYFQSGDVEGVKDDTAIAHSGPAAFGYSKVGDFYVYGFADDVTGIAERGSFLFQDRAHLANEVNRHDIKRVFVLGGSAAYGIGASSNENKWYAHLERSLSATAGREIRLIPAAHPGYGSTHERLILDLMVLPRRPDAVLIFNGFNDAVLPSIFGNRPGDPYDQGVLYADFYSPSFGLKKWLAQSSYFFRYLVHRSMSRAFAQNRERLLKDPQLLKNYAKGTASVYLDNIERMLHRCALEGIPCAVFLQPVRDLTLRSQGTQQPLDPFTIASYDLILQRLRAAVFRDAIHDLTAVFDSPGRELWYMDNVHFKDAGHAAIAAAMHPIVLDLLQDNRPPLAARPITQPLRPSTPGSSH